MPPITSLLADACLLLGITGISPLIVSVESGSHSLLAESSLILAVYNKVLQVY